MEYRNLGRTGVKVSPFCLGAMNFGNPTSESEAIRIIHAALDVGINFINTADVDYSGKSEQIVGTAIAKSSVRDKVVLSVEISGADMGVPLEPSLSRRYILQACDRALKRLQTDYIDLYNVPRPNLRIPIDETLGALTDLVQAGKVHYIGCSTFPAWMVMEALFVSQQMKLARFVTEQPPYNLLDRRIENELVPLALKYQLGLIPWAPLAQGVLAGRYSTLGNFPPDSRAARVGGIYHQRVTAKGIEFAKRFAELARKSDKTAAQLAYAWVKDQPAVTAPIVGVRTLQHLNELIPAVSMSLSDEERRACDELNPPGSVVTSFFNTAPWMKTRIE